VKCAQKKKEAVERRKKGVDRASVVRDGRLRRSIKERVKRFSSKMPDDFLEVRQAATVVGVYGRQVVSIAARLSRLTSVFSSSRLIIAALRDLTKRQDASPITSRYRPRTQAVNCIS
jgi:hypothetical protein